MKGCLEILVAFALIGFVIIIGSSYGTKSAHTPVQRIKPSSHQKSSLPKTVMIPSPVLAQYEAPLFNKLVNHFEPCREKFRALVPACNHTALRNNVLPVIHPENGGRFNLGQVCDVYDYLREWNYLEDPYKEEYFSKATVSWRLRQGDCDDFAIAMATAFKAIGGYPRITLASNGRTAHAYTEICLGLLPQHKVEAYLLARYDLPTTTTFHFRRDKEDNLFLNLDWFEEHPGGAYFDGEEGYVIDINEQECTELKTP